MSTGRLIPGRGGAGPFAPVPAPDIDGDTAAMLIGEVREDQAERNPTVRNPHALQTASAWFRWAERAA